MLKRDELYDLKRYILAQVIRTESSMEWFEDLERSGVHKNLEGMFPNIKFKEIPDETPKDKWLRGIKVLLRNDFTNIINDEDVTLSLAKFQYLIMNSYFSFWKSDNAHDFIVSDIAITNESDINHSKEQFLMRLLSKLPKNKLLFKSISESVNFHENFWMFPITPNFMIVMINPLFKTLLSKNNEIEKINRSIGYFPPTKIPTKFYEPNTQTYIYENKIRQHMKKNYNDFIGVQKYYRAIDKFRYKIHELSDKDTIYVNKLMLDRVSKEFGYNEFSKVVSSVEEYMEIQHQRNTYTSFSENKPCENKK